MSQDTTMVGQGRPPRRTSSLPSRGDEIGRYVVLEQLGRGGMGVVDSAFDPKLDRKVALKLLLHGAAPNTQASEGPPRLLREAQALAKLSHAGLPRRRPRCGARGHRRARLGRRAVARDVMILHLASLTNLYAALAWTLINLLLHPALLEQVRRECAALSGRTPADLATLETLDACAHESIRMAQRSITLRRILEPCALDDGQRVYTLQPGVLLATMLSVTNREYGDLDHFDVAHYRRGRLAAELPGKEVVSTFGHGTHACPGQRFAIAVIKLAVAGYLTRLELEPQFSEAAPPDAQMGAVARAAEPCVVRFRVV